LTINQQSFDTLEERIYHLIGKLEKIKLLTIELEDYAEDNQDIVLLEIINRLKKVLK
jgi:hypothetical protein